MMFEDDKGNILMEDEVDELSLHEIEERGIHMLDDVDWGIRARRKARIA